MKYRELKRGEASKYIIGSLRGTKSLSKTNLPLPLVKGKGIKGIGLINNLTKDAEIIRSKAVRVLFGERK